MAGEGAGLAPCLPVSVLVIPSLDIACHQQGGERGEEIHPAQHPPLRIPSKQLSFSGQAIRQLPKPISFSYTTLLLTISVAIPTVMTWLTAHAPFSPYLPPLNLQVYCLCANHNRDVWGIFFQGFPTASSFLLEVLDLHSLAVAPCDVWCVVSTTLQLDEVL